MPDDEPTTADGGGPADATQSKRAAASLGAAAAAKKARGSVQTAASSLHGEAEGGTGEAGALDKDAA